jgi:hypothetical protein
MMFGVPNIISKRVGKGSPSEKEDGLEDNIDQADAVKYHEKRQLKP